MIVRSASKSIVQCRRIFVSFDYAADAPSAGDIERFQAVLEPDNKFAGYVAAADWEALKQQGEVAIKRWILSNLNGTSVTAVLYGTQTWRDRWVRYAIFESVRRGNGLVAIDVRALEHRRTGSSDVAVNPLSELGFVIDRTFELVHFYEHSGKQWVRPRDCVETMGLSEFRYPSTRDEATFAAIAVKEHLGKRSRATHLSDWIEQAARLTGR